MMKHSTNIINFNKDTMIATHWINIPLNDIFENTNESLRVVVKSKVFYNNERDFKSTLIEMVEPKNQPIFDYLKEHDNLINPMSTMLDLGGH